MDSDHTLEYNSGHYTGWKKWVVRKVYHKVKTNNYLK